ncbi:MAG: DUF1858 domain-containing protein [Candidatus Nealsonbacteria bacterium]
MAENKKIKKEMTIGETIENNPKTVNVFLSYNLHCTGCPMAQSETIEEVAKINQIDLDKLLNDLNKALNEG